MMFQYLANLIVHLLFFGMPDPIYHKNYVDVIFLASLENLK
jgi:hypothetical protein